MIRVLKNVRDEQHAVSMAEIGERMRESNGLGKP
jgi:hypothetical protein